ncbi:unnamed protein product [Lactuca virosa]|uniref:Protein kinase domain-containing protein n=1 Tax=Lactuca virosa TaxID=75947 RepID=A0AAU9MEX7_9ASTR|nr:unnamed protein product [Lactuca virosa]
MFPPPLTLSSPNRVSSLLLHIFPSNPHENHLSRHLESAWRLTISNRSLSDSPLLLLFSPSSDIPRFSHSPSSSRTLPDQATVHRITTRVRFGCEEGATAYGAGRESQQEFFRSAVSSEDVAVKVYFGNQYSENALQDYNKEIGIMKRLRHPNVLLFMGSICRPQDKLAIVIE